MKLTGDYHTHSTHSDGRNSIVEMVDAARERGLKAVAVTDHGPKNIGVGVRTPDAYLAIKEEIKKLQENRPDIKILLGAEANIVSRDGSIDIPEEIIKELDILLVGLHPYVWPKSIADFLFFLLGNQAAKAVKFMQKKISYINTKALVKAVEKYPVDVVVHPGLGMPVDVEQVARVCAARKTAFEINVGHNFQNVQDIRTAAASGVKFIVNSDAHFTESVGKLDPGLALLAHAQVPPEQIFNIKA